MIYLLDNVNSNAFIQALVFLLANLLIAQAKIFEVNPIPDSFDTYYDTVVANDNDTYYHWCGAIGGALLPAPSYYANLTDDGFQWVGDYTGYLGTFGGDHK